MKHLILINFKAYPEGTGRRGLKLAQEIARFKSARYLLAVAPQTVDLRMVCQAVKIPVFSQHLDDVSFGPYTGSVLAEGIKEAGAFGTILNHSEKKISLKAIRSSLEICQRLNLTTVVCAPSLRWIKKIVKLNPDYIAYEPKKLIGKNISVTTTNPKVITKAVKIIKKSNPTVKLLCGAGIHSFHDIKAALQLGAEGILISHKIVTTKKPRQILSQLFHSDH